MVLSKTCAPKLVFKTVCMDRQTDRHGVPIIHSFYAFLAKNMDTRERNTMLWVITSIYFQIIPFLFRISHRPCLFGLSYGTAPVEVTCPLPKSRLAVRKLYSVKS
jgi:hypothetical protein